MARQKGTGAEQPRQPGSWQNKVIAPRTLNPRVTTHPATPRTGPGGGGPPNGPPIHGPGERTKQQIARNFVQNHEIAGKPNRPGRALTRLFLSGGVQPGRAALSHFAASHRTFMAKHAKVARSLGIPPLFKGAPGPR